MGLYTYVRTYPCDTNFVEELCCTKIWMAPHGASVVRFFDGLNGETSNLSCNISTLAYRNEERTGLKRVNDG